MPLEIRELIIKAAVNNEVKQSSGANISANNPSEVSINEVAEKVIQIIKEKAER